MFPSKKRKTCRKFNCCCIDRLSTYRIFPHVIHRDEETCCGRSQHSNSLLNLNWKHLKTTYAFNLPELFVTIGVLPNKTDCDRVIFESVICFCLPTITNNALLKTTTLASAIQSCCVDMLSPGCVTHFTPSSAWNVCIIHFFHWCFFWISWHGSF